MERKANAHKTPSKKTVVPQPHKLLCKENKPFRTLLTFHCWDQAFSCAELHTHLIICSSLLEQSFKAKQSKKVEKQEHTQKNRNKEYCTQLT